MPVNEVVPKVAVSPEGWPLAARVTAVVPPAMVTFTVAVTVVATPASTLVWNGEIVSVTDSAALATSPRQKASSAVKNALVDTSFDNAFIISFFRFRFIGGAGYFDFPSQICHSFINANNIEYSALKYPVTFMLPAAAGFLSSRDSWRAFSYRTNRVNG